MSSTDLHTLSVERTLLIFDYDDTILPSSWLNEQGLLLDDEAAASPEQLSQLSALADRAAEMLEAANDQGRGVIITNAAEGWVEHSCLRFLPSLVPILQRLPIVSARSDFQPLGIRCPTEWKCRAFDREVMAFSDMLGGGGLSVISIGDSISEHMALLRAAQKVPGCCAKSLKFAEQPSIEQLMEEHALVAGTLDEVAEFDGDLDVDVGASA